MFHWGYRGSPRAQGLTPSAHPTWMSQVERPNKPAEGAMGHSPRRLPRELPVALLLSFREGAPSGRIRMNTHPPSPRPTPRLRCPSAYAADAQVRWPSSLGYGPADELFASVGAAYNAWLAHIFSGYISPRTQRRNDAPHCHSMPSSKDYLLELHKTSESLQPCGDLTRR